MAYQTLLFDVSDGLAKITLNRPEKYNALTVKMYGELLTVFKQCARDRAIRAVLLTGAGKAFSTGADLLELQSQLADIDISEALRQGLNQIVLAIRQLEKPVVAVINGVVAGAGGGIALACDMRITSDQASFVFAAFSNIGIIPDAGTTYFLPQLVGVSKALELCLLADGENRISPEEALQLGIVNHVVPHAELMTNARAIGEQMAQMATVAVGLTKRAMYKSVERSLSQALETEAQLQSVTFQTHDFQEGVMAFIQKRRPQFKGE
ncbi:MAG: enoyl-CoA hydratase/isomerase family protein [Anaerolineae bacterium]